MISLIYCDHLVSTHLVSSCRRSCESASWPSMLASCLDSTVALESASSHCWFTFSSSFCLMKQNGLHLILWILNHKSCHNVCKLMCTQTGELCDDHKPIFLGLSLHKTLPRRGSNFELVASFFFLILKGVVPGAWWPSRRHRPCCDRVPAIGWWPQITEPQAACASSRSPVKAETNGGDSYVHCYDTCETRRSVTLDPP